jgi:hypothetical protein
MTTCPQGKLYKIIKVWLQMLMRSNFSWQPKSKVFNSDAPSYWAYESSLFRADWPAIFWPRIPTNEPS